MTGGNSLASDRCSTSYYVLSLCYHSLFSGFKSGQHYLGGMSTTASVDCYLINLPALEAPHSAIHVLFPFWSTAK